MQIMIAVPSHDTAPARFAEALAQLMAYSSATLPGAVDLNMLIGTYVHEARDRLAQDAMQSGASHVLWVDSDMRFPRDALLRLLAHGRDVVGINYTTRVSPPVFIAKANGKRVPTTTHSTGLEPVDAVGFGMVLMRTDVLTRTLEAGAPLFRHDWIEPRGLWVGEDFSFCVRARAAGFAIYVDHDLSKECAHIGSWEFRPTDVLEASP